MYYPEKAVYLPEGAAFEIRACFLHLSFVIVLSSISEEKSEVEQEGQGERVATGCRGYRWKAYNEQRAPAHTLSLLTCCVDVPDSERGRG